MLGLPLFAAARMIHCYLPILSEVDTLPLIHAALAADKLVAVPVIHEHGELVHARLDSLGEHNLLPGALGILQPRHLHLVEPGAWDVTIVPLLGFDRRGYRLGYGKGYYDGALAALAARGRSPTTIGLAFRVQEADAVPEEAHDRRLDAVLTEAGLVVSPEGALRRFA